MACNSFGPFSGTLVNTKSHINNRPKGTATGSHSYLWYTGDELGDGATGTVYVGREKLTGNLVAIKTFNESAQKRNSNVQFREFEILSKLDHINIVKFLCIENEIGKGNQILAMELCTGGSLYSILDHPLNQFGLSESEFLLVLKHVSDGMKHLRDNRIVHRDLKPGNIMRFVTDSGESIYKLVDFGAARELEDEEQFVSLYGTEEYLLPDMYESAVLKQYDRNTKQFGAHCDLWSLAVTFYHTATGKLPFRPYGGRKNRAMMHYITTTKEYGVISGVQTTPNGEIKWSRTLPTTCRLSVGLREKIRELLVGMLNHEASKMITFDAYFKMVNNIVNMRPVFVFNVAVGNMLRIYDNCLKGGPHRIAINLQEAIAKQTDIRAQDQILIYDGVSLVVGLGLREEEDIERDSTRYDSLKDGHISLSDTCKEAITEDLLWRTNAECPIFVLPKNGIDKPLTHPTLPELDLCNQGSQAQLTQADVSGDYSLAKQHCSVLYSICRNVSETARVQQMLLSVFKIISRSVKTSTEKLGYSMATFRDKLNFVETSMQFVEKTLNTAMSLSDPSSDIRSQLNHIKGDFQALKKDFSKLQNAWLQFKDFSRMRMGAATQLCQEKMPRGGCNIDSPCSSTVSALLEKITQIQEDFRADKREMYENKSLPFNLHQIHKYDKHCLGTMSEQAVSRIKEHCYPKTAKFHAVFFLWFSKVLDYLNALQNDISPTKLNLESWEIEFSFKLSKVRTDLDFLHGYILKTRASNGHNGHNDVDESKHSRKVYQLLGKLHDDSQKNYDVVNQSNNKLQSLNEELSEQIKSLQMSSDFSSAERDSGFLPSAGSPDDLSMN